MNIFSKQNRILRIIITILICSSSIFVVKQDLDNNKFYNMDPQYAIENYQKDGLLGGINQFMQSEDCNQIILGHTLLMGVTKENGIKFLSDQELNFVFSPKFGKLKLVFKNIDSNEIIVLEPIKGNNKLKILKGEYKVYSIGKSYSGKIQFDIDKSAVVGVGK